MIIENIMLYKVSQWLKKQTSRLFLGGLFVFYFSVFAYGQGSVSLNGNTSGNIVITGGAVEFTYTILNNSGAAINQADFDPQMPDGMVYVNSSINSSATIALKEPFNADKPVFQLSAIPVGSTTVTFKANAKCTLLTYLNAKNANSANLPAYKASLVYLVNGASTTTLSSQSFNDFNVVNPTVEIHADAQYETINVLQLGEYSRKISLKNVSASSLSSIKLELALENALEIQSLSLVTTNGTVLSQLALPGATQLASNGRSYNVYSFILNSFNGDNVFDVNEEVFLTEVFNVKSNKTEINSTYKLFPSDGNACSTTEALSSKTLSVHAANGDPFISILGNINSSQTYTFVIRNANINDSKVPIYDAAYNLNIDLNKPLGCNITKLFLVSADGLNRLELTNKGDYTYDFSTVPAGYGLSDLDNDGVYDDLDVDGFFKLEALVELEADKKVYATEKKYYYEDQLIVKVNFNNWNNITKSQTVINSLADYEKIYGLFYGAPNLGKPDIDPNSDAKYYFKLIGGISSSGLNLSNARWYFEITVPNGYYITGARDITRAGDYYTVEQEGNVCKITSSSNYSIRGHLIEFSFSKTCSGNPNEENLVFNGRFVYNMDNKNSYYEFASSNVYTVVNQCAVCEGIETIGFDAKRTTLGWNVLPDNTYYTYDQMYGADKAANKVNENTSGIRLNAAYANDKIKVTLKGRINKFEYNQLKAEITYNVLNADEFNYLEYLSNTAVLTVNGNSYTISGVPVVSKDGDTYKVTYDISAGNPSIPLLEVGTNFELSAAFRFLPYANLESWEYLLKKFRGRFYGHNTQSNSWESCQEYGTNFFLLKPNNKVDESINNLRQCDDKINLLSAFAQSNTIPECIDFPNEFRPIAVFQSFFLTLPKGLVFKRENGQDVKIFANGQDLNNLNFSKVSNEGEALSEIADVNTINFSLNGESKIVNSADFSNSLKCSSAIITDGRFVAPTSYDRDYRMFNVTINLLQYAYLDEPAEHVVATYNQLNNFDVNTFPRMSLTFVDSKDKEVANKTVSWKLRLNNIFYKGIDASNVWLAVEMADNEPYIAFDNPTVSGDISYYNITEGKNKALLIKLNTFAGYESKTLTINAKYNSSDEAIVARMNVYSGWSCNKNIIVSSSTSTIKGLEDKQTQLLSFEGTEGLSMKYIKGVAPGPIPGPFPNWPNPFPIGPTPPDPPIPFPIIREPFEMEFLIRPEQGAIKEIIAKTDMPENIEVLSNYNNYTSNFYLKRSDGTKQYLKVEKDDQTGNYTIDISANIGGEGVIEYPGYVIIGAQFIANLGYDPNNPFNFSVCYTTIYNEEKKCNETPFPIKRCLDEKVAVQINSTDLQGCLAGQNTNNIHVVLNLQTELPWKSDKVTIALAKNLTMGSFTNGFSGQLLSSKSEDDMNYYTYSLPADNQNSSVTIDFTTTLNSRNVDLIKPAVLISTFGVCDMLNGESGEYFKQDVITGKEYHVYNVSGIFPSFEIQGFDVGKPVCKNTKVALKAKLLSRDDNYQFLWTPGNAKSQSVSYEVTSNTNVNLRVTGSNGCETNIFTVLTTKDREAPVTNLKINSSYDCTVPSAVLSVENTSGNDYTWYKDDVKITDEISSILHINESGTYNLHVNNNDCGVTSEDVKVNLDLTNGDFNINVDKTFIEVENIVNGTISDWASNILYTWDWGSGEVSSGTYNSFAKHSFSTTGKHTVKVIASKPDGCSRSKNSVEVEVIRSLCAGTFPLPIFNSEEQRKFYLDKTTGRYVFRSNQCPNEVELGCLSGKPTPSALRRAVKASAVIYSDKWAYNKTISELLGSNVYYADEFDCAMSGKWRPEASYVYYNNLNSDRKNYNAGTFNLEAFNYQYPDCNNSARWVRTTSTEYYTPGGIALQERDAMGIPSSSKYGYHDAVVYMSAQNAEKEDIFFESFENTYSKDGNEYLEDNMLYNKKLFSLDPTYVHSGKYSAHLVDSKNGIDTRVFFFSPQIISKGLIVTCWVRLTGATTYSVVSSYMMCTLKDEAGQPLADTKFKVIAHVEDWVLAEATINDLYQQNKYPDVKMYKKFIPSISFLFPYNAFIDDIRIQPFDAKTTTYVFDPATLKISAIFDDQLFGLYYQYDQEGKLVRKMVETEKGKQTIQETFYNTPKQSK